MEAHRVIVDFSLMQIPRQIPLNYRRVYFTNGQEVGYGINFPMDHCRLSMYLDCRGGGDPSTLPPLRYSLHCRVLSIDLCSGHLPAYNNDISPCRILFWNMVGLTARSEILHQVVNSDRLDYDVIILTETYDFNAQMLAPLGRRGYSWIHDIPPFETGGGIVIM